MAGLSTNPGSEAPGEVRVFLYLNVYLILEEIRYKFGTDECKFKKTMDENVIILGAGASADSGAPLMNNFIDKAEDLLSDGLNNRFDRETRKQFGKVFELLADLQQVHSKARMDLNNIENVFGAIEMAQIIKRLGSIPPEEIATYREAIVSLIIETIEQSMIFNHENTQIYAPDSYTNLMSFISGGDFKNNTSIITFNYDIGIDTAISRAGYRVQYGFEGNQNKLNDFNLYKLHGSINWAISKNDDKIYPYYPNWYLTDLTVTNDPKKKGSCRLPISKYFSKINSHNPDLILLKNESLIVPPTWNKNSYQGTISTIWEKAAEKLSAAKRIYVIGYSLPESDSFFRYLFALGTLGSTRIRNVIVINPEPPGGNVDKRFQSLIGESILSRYSYIPKSFDSAPSIIENNSK
jgi:hypothetical protein